MKLYRSQNATVLADALADVLLVAAGSPFEPERVVVSGGAAERLLRLRIAQRLGVCANVRFLSPSTLLEQTLAALLGERREVVDAWTPERLSWAVAGLLPQFLADERFAPVRFYIGHASPGSARLMGLARRIGECFARYIVARPELVAAWEAGEGGDDWQPVLWRAIRALVGAPHLGELWTRAIGVIDGGRVAEGVLPRRLTWLTHPGIARLHLDVFAALARANVEAHLFALVPSRDGARRARAAALPHRGDEHPLPLDIPDYGNPLLESLARQSRDFELLVDRAAHDGLEEVDVFREPEGSGMLATLQHDVMRGVRRGSAEAAGAHRITVAADDASVRVHVCHGPMRQVEVLRDELLRLLDDDETLQPRDIVVLTPSMRDFAPLIEAVFPDGAPASAPPPPPMSAERRPGSNGRNPRLPGVPPAIPREIHDRPARAENAAADALLRVLAMTGGRAGATEVLDLLALPAIAARYGFTWAERDVLLAWVRDTGVRWAIDETDRARHGVPANRENTWGFGLDRLLTGWALPLGEQALYEGVLPFDEIEGARADLLGRFADACSWIFGWLRRLDGPRPMSAWRTDVGQLVEELADAEEPGLAWAAQQVRDVLDSLSDAAHSAQMESPVDLATVKLLLDSALDGERRRGGHLRNAVTFASLLPGRTVPARVVAVLGADAGVFPRQRASLGFDLLASHPRAGDPDPGSEDRQRFLEAMMAAGERFIVTYTGRTVSGNEPVPAAVPLSELLDVVDVSFTPANTSGDGREARTMRAQVVVEHPLQSFSPRNFIADGVAARGPCHDGTFLLAAQRLQGDRVPPPGFVTCEIAPERAHDASHLRLDDLTRWVESPARAFLRDRLHVDLGDDDPVLDEREPAECNHLVTSRIRSSVVPMLLEGSDAAALYPLLRAQGVLPHGDVGRLDFDDCAREAGELAEALRARRGEHEPSTLILDLPIDGVRLVGSLPHIYGSTQLIWRAGTVQPAHLAAAWVRHLAASAETERLGRGGALQTVLLGRRTESVATFAPVVDAITHLRQLMAVRTDALRTPVPFFPATSHAFIEGLRKGKDEATALRAARAVWRPTLEDHRDYCEAEDPYVARLFGGWAPGEDDARDAEFRRVSRVVWEPLAAHLTIGQVE